jgi:hypothetical protein
MTYGRGSGIMPAANRTVGSLYRLRAGCVLGAAIAALVSIGAGQALALSAACNAVNNGQFNNSNTTPPGGPKTFPPGGISNFAIGERITFVFTIVTGPGGAFELTSGNGSLLLSPVTSGTYSYTVTGNTALQDTTLFATLVAGVPGPTLVTLTATCTLPVPSGSTPGNTSGSTSGNTLDSQRLAALQNSLTSNVAYTSGQAITGAVDGAITDGFKSGGVPFLLGPNGMTLSFSGEPERDPRVEEAFEALSYAAEGKKRLRKPRIPSWFEPQWNAWLDVRGTGWSQSNDVGDTHGNQLNATAGIGYKVTPAFLIGVLTGYEHFRYDVNSLLGTMRGNGWTVGGYAAWRLAPHLRWDAMLGWSDISYDANAGTASGSFTGHRWLMSTGLTGDYQMGAYVLEPSSKVFVLWEREGDWTDSLGALHNERDFSAGRVATGGQLIYPWNAGNVRIAPYLGAYGDYRFSTDNALPSGEPVVGIGNGWSARLTTGISWACASGPVLSLGSEYGGLGATYKIWSANGRILWPF